MAPKVVSKSSVVVPSKETFLVFVVVTLLIFPPVIVIVPSDELIDKTASNMQEVIARGGKVILITNETKKIISENIRFTLEIPEANENLIPILMTIPLQLLAYHVALLKNCDIDKPRNLAKSVTVE